MMLRRHRARRRSNRGSAVIELAVSGSMLFLIAFGVIDYGRMFGVANSVAGAARAGTQFASFDAAKAQDFEGIQQAALASAPEGSERTATATQFCTCAGTVKVACTAVCPSGNRRVYIRVTVTQPFHMFWQFGAAARDRSVTSSSVVRVQ